MCSINKYINKDKKVLGRVKFLEVISMPLFSRNTVRFNRRLALKSRQAIIIF